MRAWYEGSAQISNINKVLYNILTGQNPHAGVVVGANDVITVDGTADNTQPWRRVSDANSVAGLPESLTRTVLARRGVMGLFKDFGAGTSMASAKGRFQVSGSLDFSFFEAFDPKALDYVWTGKETMAPGDVQSIVLQVITYGNYPAAVDGAEIQIRFRWLFVDNLGILRSVRAVSHFSQWQDGYVDLVATVGQPITHAGLYGLSITPVIEARLDGLDKLVDDNVFDATFPSNLSFVMPFSNTPDGLKPCDWLPWAAARELDAPDGNPVEIAAITVGETTYNNGVDFVIDSGLEHASYAGERAKIGGFSPDFVTWLTVTPPEIGAEYTVTFNTQQLTVEFKPMGTAVANKLQVPVLPYLVYEKANPGRPGGRGFYTHSQSQFPMHRTADGTNALMGSLIVYGDPNQVNDSSPIFYRVLVTESFAAICLIGDPGTTGRSAFAFFGKYVPNAPDVDLYPYIMHLGAWTGNHGSERVLNLQQSIPFGWRYFDLFHQFGFLPDYRSNTQNSGTEPDNNYNWVESYMEQLPLPNGESTSTRIDKRWQLANWLIRNNDGGGYRGALPHIFRSPGVGWSSGDFFVVNEGQPNEERYFLFVPSDGWPKVAIRYK